MTDTNCRYRFTHWNDETGFRTRAREELERGVGMVLALGHAFGARQN